MFELKNKLPILHPPDSLSDLPAEIQITREALFDDAFTIKDLAQDPDNFVWDMLCSVSLPKAYLRQEIYTNNHDTVG